MTREEKVNLLKAIIQECEEYQWWRKATLYEIIEDLEKEPFMNKPCVSAGVCEHDKMQVLDNLRAEINSLHNGCGLFNDGIDATLKLIDKYRTESRND